MTHTVNAVIQRINELRKEARPEDGSAPLFANLSIAQLVLDNWEDIERALIFSRQSKDGPYK